LIRSSRRGSRTRQTPAPTDIQGLARHLQQDALRLCIPTRDSGGLAVADKIASIGRKMSVTAIVNGRSYMHWTEPFARFIADQVRRSAKARE
jgi:hypothetical protein